MSYLNLANGVAPATPGAGVTTLYATAAGEFAYKLPAGTTAEFIGDHDHSGSSYSAIDHAHAAAYSALDHTHADIDDTGWTTATLLSYWSADAGGKPVPKYRKYGKLVVITGCAYFRPGGTSFNPMFLLPAGYRPPYQIVTPETLVGLYAFWIRTDGYVYWRPTFWFDYQVFGIHVAFHVD